MTFARIQKSAPAFGHLQTQERLILEVKFEFHKILDFDLVDIVHLPKKREDNKTTAKYKQ